VERSPLLAKSARNGAPGKVGLTYGKNRKKSWEHHVCDKIVYLPQSFAVFRRSSARRMPRVSLPEIYLKADAWIELQFCLVGERNAHYVEIIESLDAKIKADLRLETAPPRD